MKIIATSGIRKELPIEFPIEIPENAGNIIHGTAPSRLFPNTMSSLEQNWRVATGHTSFREFVSDECTHIIITMANLFRVDDHSEKMRERYKHFTRSITGYDKPLVIFGMGAQKTGESKFELSMLPTEGIEALRAIGEKATSVAVRGEFTKQMLETVIGPCDDRVFVTGCPSYYTEPAAFKEVEARLKRGITGPISVNLTDYRRQAEQSLLREAIKNDYYLVEPSNKQIHSFVLNELNQTPIDLPGEFEYLLDGGDSSTADIQIRNWATKRYRLFRDIKSWFDFNSEHVSATIGTRFHVNMASMLSGVPAVWVTHDVRTQELCDALSLPNVPISEIGKKPIEVIIREADFEKFFKNIPRNFQNFREFLECPGLPTEGLSS